MQTAIETTTTPRPQTEDPIEVLVSEHRLILRVLDALEAYARRLAGRHPPDPADLGRFVAFLRGFADRYPMAQTHLPEATLGEVARASAALDAHRVVEIASLVEIGQALIARYAGDEEDSPFAHAGCACNH